MSKKPRKEKVVQLKLASNETAKVLNLIEKLEQKTEKRLANFVNEIVKIKKNQAKIEAKLKKKAEAKARAQKKTKEMKRKKKTHLEIIKSS